MPLPSAIFARASLPVARLHSAAIAWPCASEFAELLRGVAELLAVGVPATRVTKGYKGEVGGDGTSPAMRV